MWLFWSLCLQEAKKKALFLYADETELLNTYPKMSSESLGNANWFRRTCLGKSPPKDVLLLDEDIQDWEDKTAFKRWTAVVPNVQQKPNNSLSKYHI